MTEQTNQTKIQFGLQLASFYGRFSFLSLDQLYWHYKNNTEGAENQPADSIVIIYLPVNDRFTEVHQQYLRQYPEFCCELDFLKESKNVVLHGKVPVEMIVSIEEQDFQQDVLVMELSAAESVRFQQFIIKEKTQVMEQMTRAKTASVAAAATTDAAATVSRPKRRHPRIPKVIKIRYRLSIKDNNTFETGGRQVIKQKELFFSGETANISESGVFIKSEFLPPLHAEITAYIADKLGKPIEIHGKVVRRDTNEATSGFAVELIKPVAITEKR